jgi:hypothetical protein
MFSIFFVSNSWNVGLFTYEHTIVFFDFPLVKSTTLSVPPTTDIAALKQMLLEKIAFLNAVNSPSSGKSASSALSTLLGYFWLTSILLSYLPSWRDISIMYNGKPLDDDHQVQDYVGASLHPVTMHASIRLRGGCFMVSATVLGMIMTSILGSFCTCGLSLIAVPFLLPLLFVLPFFCL